MATAAIPIIGSLLSGLFHGKPATQTQSSSGTSTGLTSGSSTGSTAPIFDPATDQLRQLLLGAAGNQLTSAAPDLTGIQSQQLENVNHGYNDASQALQQTLAARGLTYSPVAGSSQAQLGTQRIGAGIGVMNQMPLLREQLLQQRLSNALNVFRGQPYGQKTNQSGISSTNNNFTGTSTGTSTAPGGMLGGLFTGLGAAGAGGMFDDLFKNKGGATNPNQPYGPGTVGAGG